MNLVSLLVQLLTAYVATQHLAITERKLEIREVEFAERERKNV